MWAVITKEVILAEVQVYSQVIYSMSGLAVTLTHTSIRGHHRRPQGVWEKHMASISDSVGGGVRVVILCGLS